MIHNIGVMASQVVILFILIGIGFVGAKANIIKSKGISTLVNIALYISTPCVIINSFRREFDKAMLKGLLITAAFAVFTHVISILISHLVLRDKDKSRQTVLRFCVVFSNAGYMAIPLQQAILGDQGVFYGAVYIAVFNLFLWTYGEMSMATKQEDKKLSAKNIFLNPAIIGLVIGLILFFFSIDLPNIIGMPIEYLAALNTPIPMLIIGYYLSQTNVKNMLTDKQAYFVSFLRLVAIPLIALLALFFIKPNVTVATACIIAVSAPVAAASTMFASRHKRDTLLSANLVSLSTIFSIITMPIIVALTEQLFT